MAPVEAPALAVAAEPDVAEPDAAVLEPFEPQAARAMAAPSVATMDRGRRRGPRAGDDNETHDGYRTCGLSPLTGHVTLR